MYSTMFEAAELMAFQAAKFSGYPIAAKLAFQQANAAMATSKPAPNGGMSLQEAERKLRIINRRNKRSEELSTLREIANETARARAKKQGPILNKQERLEAAVKNGRFYIPILSR